MPRSLNAEIIFESWPTRSQTISSTSAASSGLVSPSNPTATISEIPCVRASRAISKGSDRLPAMIPSLLMGPDIQFVVQRFQHLAKRAQARDGNTLRFRPAQRLEEKRFQLNR